MYLVILAKNFTQVVRLSPHSVHACRSHFDIVALIALER